MTNISVAPALQVFCYGFVVIILITFLASVIDSALARSEISHAQQWRQKKYVWNGYSKEKWMQLSDDSGQVLWTPNPQKPVAFIEGEHERRRAEMNAKIEEWSKEETR